MNLFGPEPWGFYDGPYIDYPAASQTFTNQERSFNHLEGADFTVTLGQLIDSGFDPGLADYPIFDEEYRHPLNYKIIEHYWFREIGLETPGLFKRFLNRKMNEIMPMYNLLYKAQLDIDVFNNLDVYETMDRDTTGDSKNCEKTDSTTDTSSDSESETTTHTTTKATSRTLDSQTPQMQLSGREDYATGLNDATSESEGWTTSNSTSHSTSDTDVKAHSVGESKFANTEDYVLHRAGLAGILKADAFARFRDAVLNIDMMVIEELHELFMGIYTTHFNAY